MSESTSILSPALTEGHTDDSGKVIILTPKQRVFGTLRLVKAECEQAEDLNALREQLARSLDRAISWESQLQDVPDDLTIPD